MGASIEETGSGVIELSASEMDISVEMSACERVRIALYQYDSRFQQDFRFAHSFQDGLCGDGEPPDTANRSR